MKKYLPIITWLITLLASTSSISSQTALTQAGPQAKSQGPVAQAEAKGAEAKKPEGQKPGEEKTFEETVKDMEVIRGVFTFYRKTDENKLLMELTPEQLDKIYLFAATMDQSIGERGFYAAQQVGQFPFFFRRIGKNVQLVMKNTSFVAPGGTPEGRFTEKSFADAILASAKIQSKPHPERKSILIDVSDLFLNDLPALMPALNQAYQPTVYHFDKADSYLGDVKAFPENVLFEVTLHYATDNPRTFSITLPDARSVPVVLKYEFSSLTETGYKPRIADDRIGHFLTVQQTFASDHPSSPYVRYIHRWQLEKADPSAKLSSPKQPIVFWLENTIPVEYRDWIREGVLLWNKAFERIGFKNAIVVKQQPDNADWDPADTRYSTIRWFAGVDATFAIGPSRANPFTGQIYDADIGISEGLTRNVRRLGEEFVGAVLAPNSQGSLALPTRWNHGPGADCQYAEGLVQQVGMGLDVLDARGELTPEVERKLMHQYIVEVVAHEVGHTLGLRHNFRGSTLLKLSDLNNVEKTEQVGQSASVMDYNPIILEPRGEKQGDFVPTTLGPYDYWAIEYAYKLMEGDEKAELAKIASHVADPTLPYSTDEDALGTFSPAAIDPLVNQFDQTDDPLAYFRQRLAVVHELWGSMESKLLKPGEGYQILRRSLARGLAEYNRALLTSSKFIGGIYTHRDHVGDPNGRVPYETVPAAKQREALEFLRTQAFSEKAFELPPGLLNRLAIERLRDLDWPAFFTAQRLDYPWHDAVLKMQRAVLDRLYHPITLGRIEDNELRFAPEEKAFTMADLFAGLDSAIWSELDRGAPKISGLRRNLQREQLKELIRLVIRPPAPHAPAAPPSPFAPFTMPPPPPPPDDATTLARASLVSLQGKIRATLASGKVTDPTTRAHLEETQALITSTLQAQTQKTVE